VSRSVRALAALLVVTAGVVALAPAGTAQPGPVPSLPAPQPTPEESRRAADDVLARPEYQEPAPSIFERALDWLREQQRRSQRRTPPRTVTGTTAVGGGAGASFLAWVIAAVLIVVLVVVLLRLRPGARRRRADDDPLELTETEIGRPPDEWLDEAERLERQEQWKAALRCRYRSLIGSLIERGAVRDLPGRTSGEFRADVRRSAPELSSSFAEASYLFDDAWYGDLPTGRAESEAFRQLAGQVLAGASRRREPAAAAEPGSGA
jgi:hypothetical protein